MDQQVHPLPIVPDTTFTERQGVHHVGYVASQLGFIWREVTNTDLGIDGYLEIVGYGSCCWFCLLLLQ